MAISDYIVHRCNACSEAIIENETLKTSGIIAFLILTALNKPHDFILAIVEVDGEKSVPRYVRRPFKREPDFGVTSVNDDLGELLAKAEEPG